MDLVDQFLNLNSIIFFVAVIGLVWIQRKGAELLADRFGYNLKEKKYWKEFLVPLGPLGTGALLTLIPQLLLPEVFTEGALNRMVYGVAMGLLSGFFYRIFKKNIFAKLGKEEDKPTYVE